MLENLDTGLDANSSLVIAVISLAITGFFRFIEWLVKHVSGMKNADSDNHSNRDQDAAYDIKTTLYKLAVLAEAQDKKLERFDDAMNALQMNMQLQTALLTEMKNLFQDYNYQLREIKTRLRKT